MALLACVSDKIDRPSDGPGDGGPDATMTPAGDDAGPITNDAGPITMNDAGLICSDPAPWAPDTDPSTTPNLCPDPAPWMDAGAPPSDSDASDGDAGPSPVTLAVDVNAAGAPWNRFYEHVVASDHANTILCTLWGRNTQSAMKKAHAQAGFQYIRFHGILDEDVGLYSEDSMGTPVYNWARFDAVYDAILAAGMRPIVEISFMPKAMASDPTQILTALQYNFKSPNISPPKDWAKWRDLMATIVTHLEGRYGADEVRNWYFEVWNEPSWMYSLGDPGYTMLYESTATGLLQGDPQIRVGGPAGSSGESPGLASSLIRFASSSSLKLDFISYHRYSNDQGVVSDPGQMVSFHHTMATLVRDAGFSGELVNDEFGPSWKPDLVRDNETTASFIAKTIHLLGTDPVVAPPTGYGYWAISDLYEEVFTTSALSFNEGNFGLLVKGDPRYAESYDIAKPAFNAFRLLHAMGDTQIGVTGGTTGDGVNAAATMSADGSAVQILVYDHVAGGAADPTQSTPVALSVANIPFAPGPVRVRQYLVDHTHANAYTAWVAMGKPTRPSEDQWTALRDAAELCYYETTATLADGSWSVLYPQSVYGVSLFEIARQ